MSWWNWHKRTQELTAVLPPSFLCTRWCTSHTLAGRRQRGQAHPWSRSATARRMCAGTLSEYPMSSGRLAVLNGGCSSRVRSSAAMPGGPETKSMASRAIAYRSAAHASAGSALAAAVPPLSPAPLLSPCPAASAPAR